MKSLIITLCILTVSACSIVPYENEFACKKKDNLGKCINMQDAYEEAVTGEDNHPYIQPASEVDEDEPVKNKKGSIVEKNLSTTNQEESSYVGYIDNYYSEISSMVDKPVTPIIKEAKTIRTLILPYPGQENSANKTLWMERYAYTIVEEPNFIMGQYLTKKKKQIETLLKNQK